MQWYVIGRDMHVLCTPSTDITNSLPVDDSSGGQEISIVNNCAVGTYDFVTDPRHPDAQYIVEGNYIAFRDKYGKDRLYTIMTVEGDEEWDVHCEDIGLDLINEDADPWDYTGSPKSIEETLAVPLNDTGWEIGINEIADRERATKFDGNTDSQLTRIGDVCGEFDCECEFAIEMQGSKVTRQVINIYKTLGNDATQQRFVDNINLISLRKSGSIEDLITCVRCYGKEDDNGNKLTIANYNYDDGRYYSPMGHIRIYDREARQKWSRFRAFGYEGQGEFDGYINGTFEYDTDNVGELFNRGLAELQSRNDVKVSYEAKLYDVEADIGDTVQIADSSKTEKVYLSARVQSVTNYYTVKGQDTGVLANYKIMTPNQGSDLAQLMDELKGQVVSVQSTKVSYQVSNSGTEVPTGEWLDYLPGTQPGQYLWTRTVTVYTNGSSTTGYSVSRNGENGQDGQDGEQGPQGEPGQDGQDGKDGRGVLSTEVSYQAGTSGTTAPTGAWSPDIPSVNAGQYLWTKTVINYTDSTSTTLYSVAKMGTNGSAGTAGKGITSITEYYLASSSNTGITTSTPGWTTTVQTISASKKYLWNYEIIHYTDGSTTTVSPRILGAYGDTGAVGSVGTGIESITEEYYLSTSKTTQTGGSWVTTPPVWTAGKYMWTRSKIVYKNPTSTAYTTPVVDSSWEAVNEIDVGGRNLLLDSKDGYSLTGSDFTNTSNREGTKLTTLATGRGNAYGYYHQKYSIPPEELQNVGQSYTYSVDVKVTGSFTGLHASIDFRAGVNERSLEIFAEIPDDCEKDKWFRVSGTAEVIDISPIETIYSLIVMGWDDSTAGSTLEWRLHKLEKGNKASDWTPAPEDNIADVDVEYYLSTSATSLAGGSWQTVAPEWVDGKYMWSRVKTTYLNGTVKYSEPTCIAGAKGSTGNGISSITNYYLATASGSGVTTSTPGWTTAVQAITTSKKYLWNYEIIKYTNGSSTTTTPHIIGVYGNTGATGDSGIIISATAPANPKVGQLWQTASGEPIKRWNGSSWVLYYISVQNLSVSALSAISANLGTVTAGKIQSKSGVYGLTIDLDNRQITSYGPESKESCIADGQIFAAGQDINASPLYKGIDSHYGFFGYLPNSGKRIYINPNLDSSGNFDFYVGGSIPLYDRLSKDPIIFQNYAIPSISLGSNGTVLKEYTISPPSGYTLAAAIPAQTGSNQVYFYTCIVFDDTSNKLTIQLKNTGSSISVQPQVVLIFKRNWG